MRYYNESKHLIANDLFKYVIKQEPEVAFAIYQRQVDDGNVLAMNNLAYMFVFFSHTWLKEETFLEIKITVGLGMKKA